MQQSNISRSKISFGGVLQPLVESLERSPLQAGRLTGRDVVIYDRSDIQAIIALDFDNDIHLLITPITDEDPRLLKLDLKGLKVANMEWSIAGRSLKRYLDISCSTGTMPSFKRPFLRFAEDVLFEISRSEIIPADAVYKTGLRWKKFWSTDMGAKITKEWVYGLFGELLFLTDLIEKFGSDAINSWAGPLGKDHDFQTGNELAAEIKTSTEIPFSINCNIRQLDPDLFKKLYIVCYHLIQSEKGTTLPELIKTLEKMMKDNEVLLDKFYGLLTAAGYMRQFETEYNEFRLNHSEASVFYVDDDFPKLIEKSFITSPDHRITDIRYTLQLIGLEELTIDSIATELERFTKQ